MKDKKLSVYDEFSSDDVVVFSNPSYEGAIIRETTDGRAVYDYNMMQAWLVLTEDMLEDEAVEFIDYNTIGSLGDDARKPIIVYPFESEYSDY